jgi:hypothetical protein
VLRCACVTSWAAASLLTTAVGLCFPSTELRYVLGTGAEQCPEATAIRAEVARRLGYDPFLPESDSTIQVTIVREADQLTGRVELVDENGTGRGLRVVSTDPDHCAELVNTLALTWVAEELPSPWGDGPAVLVIAGASEEVGVCGTITFGTDAPPPAPTDPDVGWPPELVQDFEGAQSLLQEHSPPIEGYAYPIISQGVAATRTLFAIDMHGPWVPWCELEQSFPDGVGGYRCVDIVNDHFSSGAQCNEPVDCARANLCFGDFVCVCDASHCHTTEYLRLFDLTAGTTTAIGTIATSRDAAAPIRFSRIDPAE